MVSYKHVIYIFGTIHTTKDLKSWYQIGIKLPGSSRTNLEIHTCFLKKPFYHHLLVVSGSRNMGLSNAHLKLLHSAAIEFEQDPQSSLVSVDKIMDQVFGGYFHEQNSEAGQVWRKYFSECNDRQPDCEDLYPKV